jgi:hypothetical protein
MSAGRNPVLSEQFVTLLTAAQRPLYAYIRTVRSSPAETNTLPSGDSTK